MLAPEVLVVASDDWLSTGRLPGLLRRAGCHVTVLCPRRQMAVRTRHVDRWLATPRGPAAVVEELRHELGRRAYRWVVAADGPTLMALAARRSEDWVQADWFPVDPRGRYVELLFSKRALAQLAPGLGLAVPRSILCPTPDAAIAAAGVLGFPFFLKEDCNSAGRGLRYVGDADALAATVGGAWPPSVAQEVIPGHDVPAEALFDRGRLVCWVSSYRERAWPEPYGPSAARRYVSVPAVRAALEAIGRATGLHGFLSLDFRLDARTGAVLLLELDGRPTPTLHLGARVGADFALAIRRMLAGEQPAEPLHQRADRDPVVYMFPQDPVRSLARGTPALLLPWLFDLRRWRDIPLTDGPLMDAYLRCLYRVSGAPGLVDRVSRRLFRSDAR
jgi:predicted ATP-grasp superfamily ATP-dependent carboligase